MAMFPYSKGNASREAKGCPYNPAPSLRTAFHPMHYSLSHHKLKLILSGQGLKTGDAGGIDKLFGGKDGYYWFGTLRDMCPEGKTLSWENQYALVAAIQAHEDASAAEDEMPPEKLTPAHIAAISKLLADPV
jgi:hypothetical protein